ncbi:hypothetical protein GCM10009647_085080 [Streptomyces sanglieri]
MLLPRAADGRLVLAVDVSPWLRPDANICVDRAFCHTFGRGEGKQQMMPGWPYSVVAALETGRTSWTVVLDAVRLEPGADVAAVTAVQIREVVERLVTAHQWQPGDPEILVVLDAGYDAPRIAHLLAGLPVEILGRLRSDRVMRRPAPSREEFFLANPKGGRLPKHGGEFVFGDPSTWGTEQAMTITDTRLYREGNRAGVGPAAPTAHPAGGLARPRRTAAHHRGHRRPPGRGEAPQRRGEQAGLAVVVRHRCHRGGRRPLLAVLPPPFRHRAHVSPVQADARLDQAPASKLGSGRPLDLAGDRRLCPAPAGQPTGHRPPQALGETSRAEQTHTSPSPQRVRKPAREDRFPSRCTETIPPRTGSATRFEEPPPGHTS